MRGLKQAILPDSVEVIGAMVFMACLSLEKVFIPKHAGIKNLSDQSYESNIFISINLSEIKDFAGITFFNCPKLSEIKVDEESRFYSDIEGVLFDKERKTLLRYPNGKGKSYIVPDGVESIGDYAFSGCVDLVSVTLPESVNTIALNAFSNCHSLESVWCHRIPTMISETAFNYSGKKNDKILKVRDADKQ